MTDEPLDPCPECRADRWDETFSRRECSSCGRREVRCAGCVHWVWDDEIVSCEGKPSCTACAAGAEGGTDGAVVDRGERGAAGSDGRETPLTILPEGRDE